MKTYIIKALGSGNFKEVEFDSKYSFLWYRKLQIDEKPFISLIDELIGVAQNNKVFFVCGGVGAYLFINLSKNLGLTKDELNETGISIINTTSRIILKALLHKTDLAYPHLFNAREYNEDILSQYNIFICKADNSFSTTDEIAAYVASSFSNAELLLFKKDIPRFYFINEHPVEKKELNIDYLIESSVKFDNQPGCSFFLDAKMLELIKKKNINSTMFNSDDLGKLHEITRDKNNFKHTTITFS